MKQEESDEEIKKLAEKQYREVEELEEKIGTERANKSIIVEQIKIHRSILFPLVQLLIEKGLITEKELNKAIKKENQVVRQYEEFKDKLDQGV